MHKVPLIQIKNGNIQQDDGNVSIKDVIQRITKDTEVYIVDWDGIERNKPNLTVYQRLSEHCILWVDAGPRRLEDIVDVVMAGATTITIRTTIWPDIDPAVVREFIEGDLYVAVDHTTRDISALSSIDGVVILPLQDDKDVSDYLVKGLSEKYKVYVYSPDASDGSSWATLGVEGVLVDLFLLQGGPSNGV